MEIECDFSRLSRYNALISTVRRDTRVLESFRIMDYSLLIGIHNLDQVSQLSSVGKCIWI